MNAVLILVEVAVKFLIGVVSGAGVGTLVFGVGLLINGVTDFGGPGPPPAPAFIGLGAGLLTMSLALMILFVGPLSKRRWFVSNESYDTLPEKWKTAG